MAERARFPRPNVRNSLDFSFSGLKSAVARRAEEYGIYPPSEDAPPDAQLVANMADEFQQAVVDCMVQRTIEAVKRYKVNGVILGGGVAANSHLRAEMHKRVPVEVVVPRPGLCTDNGAMMGAAGVLPLPGRDTVAVGCGCHPQPQTGVIYIDVQDGKDFSVLSGVRMTWRVRSGAWPARLSARRGG